MPPKKKSKAKAKAGLDPAAFNDREALARSEHDIAMLQHENEVLRHELLSAKVNESKWRTQAGERLREKNEQNENYHEISASMARQFKTMQQELQKKVSALELTNANLTTRLAEQEKEAHEAKETAERREQQLTDECRELRRNMEVMSDDFAAMLRETLDKMSERITNSSAAEQSGIFGSGMGYSYTYKT